MDLEALCARDLMTPKLVFVEPSTSVRSAIREMMDHDIHSVLIRPEHSRRASSILTGKDCIQVIGDAGTEALDELCVEDIMTRPAVTVPAGLCITDCIQMMRLSGVRVAPVVDSGELVGVLSFTDVLKAVIRD